MFNFFNGVYKDVWGVGLNLGEYYHPQTNGITGNHCMWDVVIVLIYTLLDTNSETIFFSS